VPVGLQIDSRGYSCPRVKREEKWPIGRRKKWGLIAGVDVVEVERSQGAWRPRTAFPGAGPW